MSLGKVSMKNIVYSVLFISLCSFSGQKYGNVREVRIDDNLLYCSFDVESGNKKYSFEYHNDPQKCRFNFNVGDETDITDRF